MITRLEKEEFYKRYKVLYEIGEGGFAEVSKAFSTKSRKIVALKRIRNVCPREFEIHKSLQHPCIVALNDAFFVDQDMYIDLEFCGGGNITYFKPKMNEHFLVIIIRDVLKALEYIHSNGLIHMDIKPTNILIKTSGEVKVADFGISRHSLTVTSATKENSTLYLAPDKTMTSAADIWSLGMTMFEMAAGVPIGLTGSKTLAEWLQNHPHVFLSNKQKWSDEFTEVLQLMLSDNQAERPSASALLNHKLFKYLPPTWIALAPLIEEDVSHIWDNLDNSQTP